MLVGLKSLTAGELADHHDCRLGKWYDQAKSSELARQPAFGRLLAPHEAVHRFGKTAAELYGRGDREGAAQNVAEMEKASGEVIELLDALLGE
jgi:methyl-accepting chemotaxis protein